MTPLDDNYNTPDRWQLNSFRQEGEDAAMSIGYKVKARREQLGITPAELARRIGIKQPSLWAIENGKTKTLKPTTLEALCMALSTTPHYLFSPPDEALAPGLLEMLSEIEHLLHALSPADRIQFLEFGRYLAAKSPPGPRPTPSQQSTVKPIHAQAAKPKK